MRLPWLSKRWSRGRDFLSFFDCDFYFFKLSFLTFSSSLKWASIVYWYSDLRSGYQETLKL